LRNHTYDIEETDCAHLVLLIAQHPHYRDMKRYPANRFQRSWFFSLVRNI
jgi:hypothetical protein